MTSENAPATKRVRVEDIEWVRLHRRTAVTEAEHTAVRARLYQLAADLEQQPAPLSPWFGVIFGVVVIAAAFALGYGVYLLADGMWMWLNS